MFTHLEVFSCKSCRKGNFSLHCRIPHPFSSLRYFISFLTYSSTDPPPPPRRHIVPVILVSAFKKYSMHGFIFHRRSITTLQIGFVLTSSSYSYSSSSSSSSSSSLSLSLSLSLTWWWRCTRHLNCHLFVNLNKTLSSNSTLPCCLNNVW